MDGMVCAGVSAPGRSSGAGSVVHINLRDLLSRNVPSIGDNMRRLQTNINSNYINQLIDSESADSLTPSNVRPRVPLELCPELPPNLR
jgi:hypothetical protein